jgi:hypothetical protein
MPARSGRAARRNARPNFGEFAGASDAKCVAENATGECVFAPVERLRIVGRETTPLLTLTLVSGCSGIGKRFESIRHGGKHQEDGLHLRNLKNLHHSMIDPR